MEQKIISTLEKRLWFLPWRGRKSDKYALIERLFKDNFWRFRGRYFMALTGMILAAACTSLVAWLMRDVLNNAFVDHNEVTVFILAGTIIVLQLLKGLGTYKQSIELNYIGNQIAAGVQSQVYDHLIRHDVEYFTKTNSGDLITRITHNAQAARHVMDLVSVAIGRNLLTVIGLVIIMLLQDPFLTLVVMVLLPGALFFVSGLIKRVRKHAEKEFLSMSQVAFTMKETAMGIRIIKAFRLEDVMRDRMEKRIQNVAKQAQNINHLAAVTSPVTETLGGIAIAFVIIYGGWQTAYAGRTVGEYFSFLTALLLLFEPARGLARFNINLEAHLTGVRLLFELLDTPIEIKKRTDAKDLTFKKGEIKFNKVTFGYVNDQPVIKELSLHVKGGEKVALVGESGGGKSTILSLLMHFYETWQGNISIDGQDIRDITSHSLYSQIAVVNQDSFLFNASIRENITVGLPNASEDDLTKAAKAAYAHEFIEKLPNGYETIVGENGINLSGGERQRLAIARALLIDAKIILLDEATASLDGQTETQVKLALNELMKGRTALIVAHRLSTIQFVDKIYVIQNGRIFEEGTYQQLLKENGIFAKLVKLQRLDEQI